MNFWKMLTVTFLLHCLQSILATLFYILLLFYSLSFYLLHMCTWKENSCIKYLSRKCQICKTLKDSLFFLKRTFKALSEQIGFSRCYLCFQKKYKVRNFYPDLWKGNGIVKIRKEKIALCGKKLYFSLLHINH